MKVSQEPEYVRLHKPDELKDNPPPSNFIQQVLGHTKKKVEVYINLFTFQNNFTSYGTGTHPMSMLVLRIRIRIRGKRVWVLHSDMDPSHY